MSSRGTWCRHNTFRRGTLALGLINIQQTSLISKSTRLRVHSDISLAECETGRNKSSRTYFTLTYQIHSQVAVKLSEKGATGNDRDKSIRLTLDEIKHLTRNKTKKKTSVYSCTKFAKRITSNNMQ